MKTLSLSNIIRLGSIVSIRAFSPMQYNNQVTTTSSSSVLRPFASSSSSTNPNSKLNSLISSGDSPTTNTSSSNHESNENENDVNFNKSTLPLLEHINLNVPNHDYILDFYLYILGMGLDPRRASNVLKGSGTVWANCGASQFHLPYGEVAQVIPGSIGLVYDDLNGVVERLDTFQDSSDKPYSSYSIEDDGDEENGDILCVRIVDRYGNVFYCRKGPQQSASKSESINDDKDEDQLINTAKQPIIYSDKEEHIQEYQDVANKYGLKQGQETECRGISYVEFNVPKGFNSNNNNNKIEDLAEFYDCVFDAPTNVVTDPRDECKIAIIGFGTIDLETGKASQSLLFREKNNYELPKYDGHHIAFYVGENQADFEKAFENALEAGVVWVNPRFSDKVTNLNTAKKWKQFRLRDLISLEHGKKIYQLEHEVRSLEHDAWPGKSE